jgi:hypothetical protein
MIRRWRLTLVLALLAGAGACGDGGGGGATPEEQSIVVITLNFEVGVPELRQIRVNAHLADPAMDSDLYFPTAPAGAIQSGATLALLIPTTRMGLLDLIVFGLDAGGTAVARGNGQTTIAVGDRVDKTISLSACGGPCN